MIGYWKRATGENQYFLHFNETTGWQNSHQEGKKLFRWHFRVPRVPFDPDRSWTHSRDAYAISLSKLERRYCWTDSDDVRNFTWPRLYGRWIHMELQGGWININFVRKFCLSNLPVVSRVTWEVKSSVFLQRVTLRKQKDDPAGWLSDAHGTRSL